MLVILLARLAFYHIYVYIEHACSIISWRAPHITLAPNVQYPADIGSKGARITSNMAFKCTSCQVYAANGVDKCSVCVKPISAEEQNKIDKLSKLRIAHVAS